MPSDEERAEGELPELGLHLALDHFLTWEMFNLEFCVVSIPLPITVVSEELTER